MSAVDVPRALRRLADVVEGVDREADPEYLRWLADQLPPQPQLKHESGGANERTADRVVADRIVRRSWRCWQALAVIVVALTCVGFTFDLYWLKEAAVWGVLVLIAVGFANVMTSLMPTWDERANRR